MFRILLCDRSVNLYNWYVNTTNWELTITRRPCNANVFRTTRFYTMYLNKCIFWSLRINNMQGVGFMHRIEACSDMCLLCKMLYRTYLCCVIERNCQTFCCVLLYPRIRQRLGRRHLEFLFLSSLPCERCRQACLTESRCWGTLSYTTHTWSD